MKQIHVTVFGMIQGVGYRYFISQKAKELRLNGWIKNKKDGNVEAVFQTQPFSPFGQPITDQEAEMTIQKMLGFCKEGPTGVSVVNIESKWEDAEDEKFDTFEVRQIISSTARR